MGTDNGGYYYERSWAYTAAEQEAMNLMGKVKEYAALPPPEYTHCMHPDGAVAMCGKHEPTFGVRPMYFLAGLDAVPGLHSNAGKAHGPNTRHHQRPRRPTGCS